MVSELSDQEILRYNRQIILQDFDFAGQEKLKIAKVLIVGVGGLGCTAAQYLAAAGVGQITLLDFDTVLLANLQQQILYSDQTIGTAKVDAAKASLVSINPHIKKSAYKNFYF
ncbi:MAG: ThiF family adenylyltransferase [Arsenophonus endosymbiont of Dermacentor nuttalli]